jgi:predicted DNA-binding transcriptional regulator YafY
MRADRLVATLLLMQARGRVTARQLADELEISVATARRDLEALSTAGIPVYPQPGRGGGWSLLGGARTDLSGLSATEAQALFLLVGPAASVAPEAKAALRKLVRALPDTFRADAEAAADAVVIDSARWGEHSRERPELVQVLQTAVVRRRKVRLIYTSRAHGRSERLVDPLGMIDKDDVWYLLAGTEDGQRTFRVDRIVEALTTDLQADRPADFALSDAWDCVVDEVEQQRSLVSATVLIQPRFVWALRGQLGRHCEVDGPAEDGRVRVRGLPHAPDDRSTPGRMGRAHRRTGFACCTSRIGQTRQRAHRPLRHLTMRSGPVPTLRTLHCRPTRIGTEIGPCTVEREASACSEFGEPLGHFTDPCRPRLVPIERVSVRSANSSRSFQDQDPSGSTHRSSAWSTVSTPAAAPSLQRTAAASRFPYQPWKSPLSGSQNHHTE